MRAFVTGGSGFLGRNLIVRLRERGDTVRALTRSDAAAAAVGRAGAEPVFGDLDNGDVLRVGMTGCDVVFHLAAQVGDWGRLEDFERVNVGGTTHVLAAAAAVGVPRLVHVSTEAVLVGGPPLVNADETWSYPARPLGPYPMTKGRAERRVRAANSERLATVVVRPRFLWGKGDTTVLPQLARTVRAGQFAWIDGGRYLTSTCHVANACEGLLLAAGRGRGGEVYFVTDGSPIEFRDLVTRLLRMQGLEPGGRSLPRWLAWQVARASELAWRTLRLKGAPPLTRSTVRLIGEEVTVNDAKARRELGYTGAMSREAGLATMTPA